MGVSRPETAAADSLGQRAERYVHDILRAALPREYILFPNVAWVVRDHGTDREGEADLIIAHPELGFLVIEIKSGPISRDASGRWWAGGRPLDRPPFQQAADSHHSLVRKLRELPDWPAGLDPIAGHAVAFPNADLASLGTKIFYLGPDVDPELILDKTFFAAEGPRNARLRAWVERRLRAVERRGEAGARHEGDRAPRGDDDLAVGAAVAAPIRDRRRRARGRAPDRRAALHAQHAARHAAGGRRRGSGDRQDDAGDGQGRPARDRGLRDPARLLQLGRSRARSRTRPGTWRSGRAG